MSGDEIALDTNAASAILDRRQEIESLLRGFHHLALPVVALGELRFGALNSKRQKENAIRLAELISIARVLEVDDETASVYANIRMSLKSIGRPIPENDMWIAACAIRHGPPLATADRHFASIEGLRAVSWLEPA
jgi:tRNA(fMet)-specific endonuclease VapC